MAYGKHLILDLYDCDVSKFNREFMEEWVNELCVLIDMEQENLEWWDYEGVPVEERDTAPHLVGTSMVQFIKTSNIIMHSFDLYAAALIDVFSCKDYVAEDTVKFTADWFGSKKYDSFVLLRGEHLEGGMLGDIPEIHDCVDCAAHGKCTGPQHKRLPCTGWRKE